MERLFETIGTFVLGALVLAFAALAIVGLTLVLCWLALAVSNGVTGTPDYALPVFFGLLGISAYVLGR